MKNIFYDKKRAIDRISLIDKSIVRILGIELKRRRMQASRTLSDYSCGCSLSYLSKFENGKIIPKYEVINDYCEQNGITNLELEMMLEANIVLDKMIFAYTKGDYNSIIDIAYETKLCDNYKAYFIQMFHQLIYFDYDGITENIEKCNVLYNDYDVFDKAIVIFFKMIISNKNEKYFETIKTYKDFVETENKALNALINKNYYIACLESAYIEPAAIKQETLNSFLMFDTLINASFFEAYQKANIKAGVVYKDYEIAYMTNRNKILYYGFKKQFDKLEELRLDIEDQYDQLLIDLFIGRIKHAITLYEELDKSELSKSTLLKLEFMIDVNKLDNLELSQRISKYYIVHFKEVHDFFFLKKVLGVVSELATNLAKPILIQKAYQEVSALLFEYFNNNQLVLM